LFASSLELAIVAWPVSSIQTTPSSQNVVHSFLCIIVFSNLFPSQLISQAAAPVETRPLFIVENQNACFLFANQIYPYVYPFLNKLGFPTLDNSVCPYNRHPAWKTATAPTSRQRRVQSRAHCSIFQVQETTKKLYYIILNH
jgi:hypothetical protein